MGIRVFILVITTFDGLDLRAQHYYGSVKSLGKKITREVEKALTAGEAKLLNGKEGHACYKAGEVTVRLNSEEEVISTAIGNLIAEFGEDIILLRDCDKLNPGFVLYGPEGLKESFNPIAKDAERIWELPRDQQTDKLLDPIWGRWRVAWKNADKKYGFIK